MKRHPVARQNLATGGVQVTLGLMVVVDHLPFLKSTTTSSPEAADLLTFHPVSTHGSPRGLDFIRAFNPDVSIWTGLVSRGREHDEGLIEFASVDCIIKRNKIHSD